MYIAANPNISDEKLKFKSSFYGNTSLGIGIRLLPSLQIELKGRYDFLNSYEEKFNSDKIKLDSWQALIGVRFYLTGCRC